MPYIPNLCFNSKVWYISIEVPCTDDSNSVIPEKLTETLFNSK